MHLPHNLSLLAIILIYFVQMCVLVTDIPTTTTAGEDLSTTDLEDLFKAYDAQYPQERAGMMEEEEYQNDGKVVGVLEDIDRVIGSIEKIIDELQKELTVEDTPKLEKTLQRKKRIPAEKNLWDVGQFVEKASSQLILLNKLQDMKKKQMKAVEAFLEKSDEKISEDPKDPREIFKEHTLQALREKQAARRLDSFRDFFSSTSTTTYPPIKKIKNKIVAETDDFYEDDPLDRRVRSVDSQFFTSLASYLMRSFGNGPESGSETLVKRQIDAHNDLENEVIPTTRQSEEVIHPKSESPLVEAIKEIEDPEMRKEFTKDIHPKIEELEEIIQEPIPVHLTVVEEDGTVIELTESPKLSVLQESITEEPPKEVTEGETEKREVSSTVPDVVTTTAEAITDTTPEYFNEESVSENEVISQGDVKEARIVHEDTTESLTEATTVSYQEETTLMEEVGQEVHQILAEDKFEEAILLPKEEPTTVVPDTVLDERISLRSQDVLGENFATEFPTVEETTTETEVPETETTTSCSEFEQKVNNLKNDLEKDSKRSSSSSSSSEESHEKGSESSTFESVSSDSTTVKSVYEEVGNETLSKGDLYDLLSRPISKPESSESTEDKMQKIAKKEAKSRSLDISQRMIVSQAPEEISAIEDDIDPASDNHSVKKKEGVSRELPLSSETTTEIIDQAEGRSLDGEIVEDALQTIVDTVDIVMDTKKTIEAFHDTVETTETPLTTYRASASTKNNRDVVGFGLDDSSLGHEESLPLDRTPAKSSTVVLSTATSAILTVILLLGIGVFAVMKRTRVHGDGTVNFEDFEALSKVKVRLEKIKCS